MTTQYVALHTTSTVDETIEALRALDEDHPTVNYVYVLDEFNKLVGVLSLRTLVLAESGSTLLKDIMFDEIITATPDESDEDVAADISKYDLLAMPVVDENGIMLGIVTVDDAIDVIEDDAEEDITRRGWVTVIILVVAFIVFLFPYTWAILTFFKG